MDRFVRRAPLASALMLLAILLFGPLPAAADSEPEPTPKSAPTQSSDEVIQALVVGSTAFALMVAAAGGVLFYTARRRGDEPG